MRKRDFVVLHDVYRWVCPFCSAINHTEPVMQSLTDDDKKAIAEEQGIDPDSMDGEWFAKPTEVTCRKCDRVYDVFEDNPDDNQRGESAESEM